MSAHATRNTYGFMGWLFGIVFLALQGCTAAPATPEERDAALCIRDALKQSPHIVSAEVVESPHHVMVVSFAVRYEGGKVERSVIIIQENEPNAPGLGYMNFLGYLPTDFGIEKLLEQRCPAVRNWTPEV